MYIIKEKRIITLFSEKNRKMVDVFLRIKEKKVGFFQITHTDIVVFDKIHTVEKGVGAYEYEYQNDPERSSLILISIRVHN